MSLAALFIFVLHVFVSGTIGNDHKANRYRRQVRGLHLEQRSSFFSSWSKSKF
jgi:hypothetical protein